MGDAHIARVRVSRGYIGVPPECVTVTRYRMRDGGGRLPLRRGGALTPARSLTERRFRPEIGSAGCYVVAGQMQAGGKPACNLGFSPGGEHHDHLMTGCRTLKRRVRSVAISAGRSASAGRLKVLK
jgi:hypothetical protein